MSLNKLTPSELKAMRQGLGMTVKEAAELKAINVTPRALQYWESGRYEIPNDVSDTFYAAASQYQVLIGLLKSDIARFKEENPLPVTDDADEYFKLIKNVKKLVLPFYTSFDDFKAATGNPHIIHWRLWQSAISHLFLIGDLTKLDDSAIIPSEFRTWGWIKGAYGIECQVDC